MVNLDATIPEDLNKQFRDIVVEKYGYKRGNISRAVEDAITDYVAKNKNIITNTKDKTDVNATTTKKSKA